MRRWIIYDEAEHFHLMMNLRGKRALVMGLGVHGGGLGVARFLVGQGADVTVTDLRPPEALRPSLDALAGLPIRYALGAHRDDDFAVAELVVRNPGVPRESRFLQIARAAGAQIEMEMTLFFRLCPGPLLGITGTKGKTTTTLLAGAMLRQQYADTVVAGNLRVSALEALPRIGPATAVVLELSSWQLEGLGEARLSPQYACVTNLSPDHLNRYGSMADYAEAKKQIFRWQGADGVVVLNADDAEVAGWAGEAPGAVVWFGERQPRRTGGSVVVKNNALWWSAEPGHQERICAIDEIKLPGRHNVLNVAAAAALACSFGVEVERIRAAIGEFAGVPDRLELVRELDGVRYVNDTTATAPEAAIAALHSFDGPIVLLCGGADKDLPFDTLARAIVERARAAVLLSGTATPKLMQALEIIDERRKTDDEGSRPGISSSVFRRSSFVHGPFDDFERAIAEARALAEPGDVVLLSPGCASFGMFANEFHRGEEFRRIVNGLSAERAARTDRVSA
jgi:UDP-N-acetylmuramoylalanine--D-glutamate ligase